MIGGAIANHGARVMALVTIAAAMTATVITAITTAITTAILAAAIATAIIGAAMVPAIALTVPAITVIIGQRRSRQTNGQYGGEQQF